MKMRTGWLVIATVLVACGASAIASAQDRRVESRGHSVTSELRFDGSRRERGALALDRDFTRDPGAISGRAAGRIPGTGLGLPAECPGFFEPRVSHTVDLRGDMPSIDFAITARRDTTLVIVSPDGHAWCDTGPAPRVRGWFAAGVYHVFVGRTEPGRPVSYSLRITRGAAPPVVTPPVTPPPVIVTPPPVVVTPPRPSIDVRTLPGTYEAVHPHWRDTVILSSDGTYRRGSGDPGVWRVEGTTLVLAWTNWGPERLDLQPDGSFRAPTNGFTLIRRSTVVVTPPPPPPSSIRPIDPRTVPGTYDGVHRDWRDSVIISADGTYRRGSGDAGRWTIENNELVLDWTNWGEERLARQTDGSFVSPTTAFRITPRTGVVVTPPAAPVCRQTLLELGHPSGSLMFCDGVEPRCADALLRAGHAPSALMFCRDVEPTCAVQMLRSGRAPSELIFCD